MLFATVDDLLARWPEIDTTRAEAFLEDVSVMIAYLWEQSGITTPEPGSVLALNAKAVCCEVARRVMSSENAGVKSVQEMAGPFMETLSFESPSGDMYLTSAEKKRLGIGRQRISFKEMS